MSILLYSRYYLLDLNLSFVLSLRNPLNNMSDCASQPTCFNGHNLKLRVHNGSWYCSMCGCESTSNVSLFSCHMCDFDTCLACTSNTYRKEHYFVASECTEKSNLTCIECDEPITGRYFVCSSCEWILCEACAVAYNMKKINF